MTIEIRRARESEWPAVADITKTANDEYASSADPKFWSAYEKSTRETIMTDEGAQRVVSVVDGQIVASVIYCPPYEKELAGKVVRNPHPEMRLLSVLPAHRNKGIGGKLIDFCEKMARRDGDSVITLHTTDLMAVAKAMYERRGYERYSDIDFQPAPGFTVWGYRKEFDEHK